MNLICHSPIFPVNLGPINKLKQTLMVFNLRLSWSMVCNCLRHCDTCLVELSIFILNYHGVCSLFRGGGGYGHYLSGGGAGEEARWWKMVLEHIIGLK